MMCTKLPGKRWNLKLGDVLNGHVNVNVNVNVNQRLVHCVKSCQNFMLRLMRKFSSFHYCHLARKKYIATKRCCSTLGFQFLSANSNLYHFDTSDQRKPLTLTTEQYQDLP